MRRHDIRTGGIYYGTADYKTDINWRNASDGYGNCSNLNGSRNALCHNIYINNFKAVFYREGSDGNDRHDENRDDRRAPARYRKGHHQGQRREEDPLSAWR